ncbi:MAG: RnfABCDGE type electron transport complex subunit D [Candidatus Muirbacterium halophilum]|nr:RnfABCDGE type electron transport complex subunit D [Candidatus Muirbacterium halophilum]MCK9475979.1 RnfABCDGE type electron transport complex subunit D [Candidatus Muirbacterium halophilum]
MEKVKLAVTPAPHIKSIDTVSSVMLDVVIALCPAILASIIFFGIKALIIIVTCVAFAVLSEYICQRLMDRPVRINDFSAVVTGILLAFCLPPSIPWYIAALGAVFAIVIGKMVFGGLGYNIFNPALVGRAFLLASWPVFMTSWSLPEKLTSSNWASLYDSTTSASALGMFKEALNVAKSGGGTQGLESVYSQFSISSLFFGNVPGSLGETSVIALLLGAFYLWFYKKHITWHIPVTYIATVGLLAYIGGGPELMTGNYLFHITSGGLILGAFFMATDMVTSPITPYGRIIFGLGAGLLVFIIRIFGGYPEGVCYSILIMNAATPLIDRWTRPRKFGEVR